MVVVMVVLTFISPPGVKIPHYTYYCIKQLRLLNPNEEIHFISGPDHGFEKIFEQFDVSWFDSNYYDTYELMMFHKSCDLKRHGTPNTKHPSPPEFFYRAMERLFYLQAHQEKYDITGLFHTENDVLTYYPLDEVDLAFAMGYEGEFDGTIINMGAGISTAAFSYFYKNSLEGVCNKILKYIDMGEQNFCQKYKVDMFNEMTALRAYSEENNKLTSFETFPTHYNSYVFDPGSYGQYLGGTNNEHGPGWAGSHHYIGKEILEGRMEVFMHNNKPMVKRGEYIRPIFNLHIHSKNLKDFAL